MRRLILPRGFLLFLYCKYLHLLFYLSSNLRVVLDEKFCGADMDDTLVLTGEADARAYSDVMKLATQLHEQVNGPQLPLLSW